MNDSIKNKDLSPLVKAVLSLDHHFTSLERLSSRIDEMKLKSEFDCTQIRRLMAAFAESATSVSTEIMDLAQLLGEAKVRSENAARIVSAKAEILGNMQSEKDIKMEAFQVLTSKVAALSNEMKDLQKPAGETLSDEERASLTQRLTEVNSQLLPLIAEARALKEEARNSQMKVLEQNADALGQSLTAVTQKLASFIQTAPNS